MFLLIDYFRDEYSITALIALGVLATIFGALGLLGGYRTLLLRYGWLIPFAAFIVPVVVVILGDDGIEGQLIGAFVILVVEAVAYIIGATISELGQIGYAKI